MIVTRCGDTVRAVPRACVVLLLLSVAAPASAQDVAILGPVPSDLAEELDWELGDITRVRTVPEGFAASTCTRPPTIARSD